MIDVKIGNYRIANISRLSANGIAELLEKDGLGIEKKCKTHDGYYVICFVKYNEDESACEIEPCGCRLLDIEDDEWTSVKSLINIACKIVSTSNQYETDQRDAD